MNIIPFIITLVAGLSTLIGSLFIFIFKNKNKDKIILSTLSFASSVMILISFTDLIPESYNSFINYVNPYISILHIVLFIYIGLILSLLIDRYVKENDNKLYRVGVISMIAIILHNIPEGMATFIASNTDIKLGIKLAISITLHNIPEGISIAIPIYYSTDSKFKAILYTLLAGISELLGAIIVFLFLRPFINNYLLAILFSLIAGIMMYISTIDLLITSISYNNKKLTFIYFILGVIFISICNLM